MAGIDSNTLLLLHGEDLTDSSQYAVPLTNNGVQVSNAQSKFGGKSLYFNGASALLFPASTIVYSDKDFTLDWWEYCTGTDGMTRYSTLWSGTTGMSVGYSGTDLYMARNTPWDMLALTNTAFSVTLNTWVHWAVVRNGNSVKTYRNGVEFASATVSGAVQADTSPMCIGAHGSGNYRYFKGYIDEFRISDVARWTSNFTPPTEPYTAEAPESPGDFHQSASVVLRWNSVDCDGYHLYKNGSLLATTTETIYIDENVSNGQDIEYSITAYRGTAESEPQTITVYIREGYTILTPFITSAFFQ